ncbi:hypothetical protein BFINE_09560 [Bacteroides finegoldii DSM 17565]|nr:hypothetical protein BFINE_09560 [Bacteroides finegoldii DSM 17565]
MTSFLNNHKQRETDENNDTHKGIENGKPLDIPRFLRKGERWSEYLNLFLVPDDTPDAKRLNDASMAKANEIKSKRLLGIDEDETETGAVNPTSYPNGFLPTGLTII